MKKRSVSSILFLCILLLQACRKDHSPTAGKTNTELISQNSWKFSSAAVSGTDASAYLQACQKDNVYTFAAAGTGTFNEGIAKCNAADPQSNSFTWNFAGSESMLHISTVLFTGGSNDFTLVSLTATQLVGSQNYPPYGTIVVTFVH